MNGLLNNNAKRRRVSRWLAALLVLLPLALAILQREAVGAELVPFSPAEQEVLSTEYSVPSTRIVASLQSVQCPGGICPSGACPVPPAPRSPRQFSAPLIHNPQSSIQNLSAAAFDAVVKVSADNQRGGSGVLVECDGQAIVLTAEHVVRGANSAKVTFRDGQQFTSHEILVDRDRLDLAAMVIEWPRQVRPAIVGDMPHAGDVVIACGYGMDGILAGLPNTIRGVRFSRLGSDVTEPDSLEMLGTFRSGDSGGPVFNQREQVVAIVNASSAPGAANQSNVAVACRPIRAFLARLRERLKGRGQRGEGRSERKTPGEIAPGISVPQVELPAEGGCRCDPTAPQRILDKLDVLEKRVAASSGELAASQSAGRTDIKARLDKLQVEIFGDTAKHYGDTAKQENTMREAIVAAIAQRAPAAGMTLGKLLAGALGLSTPVGLGIGVAGWLVGRRLKRRAEGRRQKLEVRGEGAMSTSALCPQPSALPERTVILETPPPPQIVERSQQFVPYQAQSARLDALERAMAEYVRKYPSAAGVFETINVYANQFQSGEKK